VDVTSVSGNGSTRAWILSSTTSRRSGRMGKWKLCLIFSRVKCVSWNRFILAHKWRFRATEFTVILYYWIANVRSYGQLMRQYRGFKHYMQLRIHTYTDTNDKCYDLPLIPCK